MPRPEHAIRPETRPAPSPACFAWIAWIARASPQARRRAPAWLVAIGAATVATSAACTAPVAAGLDDPEANRVVVALAHASVDSMKEPDPAAEGRWRVEVTRDDVAHAIAVLRDEELPRDAHAGMLEALSKGALVPSEAVEHAQLVAGMGGEIERSLEGVDGVLSARVHLSVPMASPLRELATPRSSASVLLEHRGATPPLSADSVQRLVAGAIAGMIPAEVTVVMVSRGAPPLPFGSQLGHVGPIAVARASMRQLQAALVALVAIVALLAGATLVLSTRLSRLRAELGARPEPKRPAT
jgi:type III secretion protein J